MGHRKSSSTRRPQGFTLIELMVTVVVLAVLATVAMVSYTIYVRRARSAEARGLLANIKAQQEAYQAEFGVYCDVGTAWPAADPGQDAAEWNPVAAPVEWKQLGFVPDQRWISFQLNTKAGPGASFPFTSEMGLDSSHYEATDHWFVAWAIGDQDGDGGDNSPGSTDNSVFWITHETNSVGSKRAVE